ncbi:Tyrosylprotein sulfotransferase isoform 2 [Hibiscus syriacus]|uniref:Tyrosylprotein sulfotransferase isoform 2 n=1 Tax=Hibiscus syriacus TaxID=106335 RepID=A0A6A2XFQ9_HIBSY|nr:Tyrosylprotein sulfotransferase isoform 2 [Hibiscus syriacus]
MNGSYLVYAFSVNDYEHCENVVKNWATTSLKHEHKEDKHTLKVLLFFLHDPRTGGRTYFHCFLKKLYSSSLECPRSYDRLRFDPSKEKCRLLVTHDDYSITSRLPRGRTSVVRILRNPIDRAFCTCEFSVEVAARFLVHSNLTSATQMTGCLRSKTKGVSTLDIWPWKYLVPWMREDLFARLFASSVKEFIESLSYAFGAADISFYSCEQRDARKARGTNEVTSIDPYNMEDIAMLLLNYINDPIAHEIVHNGATFQIAGSTNNSYLPESHEVCHCVDKYHNLVFANVVRQQVISQLVNSKAIDEGATVNRSGPSSFSDSELDQKTNTDEKGSETTSSSDDNEVKQESMTVGKLMDTYEVCISGLRKTQTRRRIASLKRISPANFTKESFGTSSSDGPPKILTLNKLDIELYEYAQGIFAK